MPTAIFEPERPDMIVLDLGEGELHEVSTNKAQHLLESLDMAFKARRVHLEQESKL